jgi:hypothetical protein
MGDKYRTGCAGLGGWKKEKSGVKIILCNTAPAPSGAGDSEGCYKKRGAGANGKKRPLQLNSVSWLSAADRDKSAVFYRERG